MLNKAELRIGSNKNSLRRFDQGGQPHRAEFVLDETRVQAILKNILYAVLFSEELKNAFPVKFYTPYRLRNAIIN